MVNIERPIGKFNVWTKRFGNNLSIKLQLLNGGPMQHTNILNALKIFLIINSMLSSCADYGNYANTVLAKQFDPKILDSIWQIEAAGYFSNPKYMELRIPNFYAKHICRITL